MAQIFSLSQYLDMVNSQGERFDSALFVVSRPSTDEFLSEFTVIRPGVERRGYVKDPAFARTFTDFTRAFGCADFDKGDRVSVRVENSKRYAVFVI